MLSVFVIAKNGCVRRPHGRGSVARSCGLAVCDLRFASGIEARLLADPLVEFVGEVNDAQKQDLLGNALALLFTIDWPEPFGLVLSRRWPPALP
jgi:glycosyltransferase involved in cell wall biosynthesis